MNHFTPAETVVCCQLIAMALEEDLGDRGDVTSKAVIPEDLVGRAVFVARASGVLAGLPACQLVLETVDSQMKFEPIKKDGEQLSKGDRIAIVSGRMRSILAAERTALNFLQHLSGIATLTRKFVDAVAGLPVEILDTRKTLPGWRLLEKYAVRCGGGHNHRMGLHDGVLVKDNHVAALGNVPNPIASAAARAAREIGEDLEIEIEVATLDQFDAARSTAGVNVIMLDNMTLDQMREAVRRNTELSAPCNLEASGGVNLQTVRGIAETGVDRISVGALTHSAPALDIALDYDP